MAVAPPTAGAIAHEAVPTPVHRLGEHIFDAIAEIGDVASFSVLTLVWIVRRRSRWSVLVPIFYAIGVKSVSVVAITGTFIGMVLAVQAYHQFAMMGLATRLGSVINISIVRELGPVLAATMLAGRVGSAMAAELGTMRVTEQIDALSALGTNPIYYLVVPRFLACVLLDPALDPDGRLHGGDRRRGRQHPDPQRRLVRLLDAHARLRRQPRHLRRRVQELFLRRGDCPDQLPPRVQFQGRRRGGGPGRHRGVRLLVHRDPVPRLRARARLEQRLPVALAPGGRTAMSAGRRHEHGARRDDLIEVRDVSMRFRQQTGPARHRPDDPSRRDGLHHRRERLRQDRDAQADDRSLAARRRGACGSTAATSPSSDGKELVKMRLRFGFLFQMAALFDSLTIFDNVAFGLREHHLCDEAQVRQIVAERLQEVGLPPESSRRSRPSSPAASGSGSGWPGPWRSARK